MRSAAGKHVLKFDKAKQSAMLFFLSAMLAGTKKSTFDGLLTFMRTAQYSSSLENCCFKESAASKACQQLVKHVSSFVFIYLSAKSEAADMLY
jgi:hypothetical protein